MSDEAAPQTVATPVVESAPVGSQKPLSAIDSLFAKEAKDAPKVEAEVKVAPKVDSQAKTMALIAREQKRLAAERDSFKQSSSQFAESQKELESLRSLKQLVKEQPLKALTELGLDYNQLIELEIQRQKEEADPTLKKVRELETKLQEKERLEAEAEVRQQNQAAKGLIADHVNSIKSFVTQNQDKYEFINKYQAEQVVWDKIKEVFDSTVKRNKQGQITDFTELTNEEACDLIEAEFEQSALELVSTKKMQSRFAQTAQKDKPVQTKQAEPKSKITLSNALTQEPVSARSMSKQDRAKAAYERLINSH